MEGRRRGKGEEKLSWRKRKSHDVPKKKVKKPPHKRGIERENDGRKCKMKERRIKEEGKGVGKRRERKGKTEKGRTEGRARKKKSA